MHPTNSHRTAGVKGGAAIWTFIIIAALCCMAAVLILQIKEHLFYSAPPSVWPQPAPAELPETAALQLPEGEAVTGAPSPEDQDEPGIDENEEELEEEPDVD